MNLCSTVYRTEIPLEYPTWVIDRLQKWQLRTYICSHSMNQARYRTPKESISGHLCNISHSNSTGHEQQISRCDQGAMGGRMRRAGGSDLCVRAFRTSGQTDRTRRSSREINTDPPTTRPSLARSYTEGQIISHFTDGLHLLAPASASAPVLCCPMNRMTFLRSASLHSSPSRNVETSGAQRNETLCDRSAGAALSGTDKSDKTRGMMAGIMLFQRRCGLALSINPQMPS